MKKLHALVTAVCLFGCSIEDKHPLLHSIDDVSRGVAETNAMAYFAGDFDTRPDLPNWQSAMFISCESSAVDIGEKRRVSCRGKIPDYQTGDLETRVISCNYRRIDARQCWVEENSK